MKVSIIIPVYNTEKYLRQCFDSVLNQTLKDIELIVVDDGSSDGSAEIIKEYAEKYPDKFKAFYKENGGQASARNLALPYATGEYLGFVDSDDWIDAEMYEEMYGLAKEENTDIVICDMIDHYPTHEHYHHASEFTDKFRIAPSACNKIFRRDFVGDINFPVGLWYEDFEFTTKNLMLTDKISVIHKGFYHCHCREVSTMSNNNSEKNLNMLKIFDNLIEFMEERSLMEKYKDELEYLHLDHILFATITRVEKHKNKNKRTVIKQLRKAVKARYPKFYKGAVFASLPKKHRNVVFANYMGLSPLVRFLVRTKQGLKKGIAYICGGEKRK